MASLTIWNRLEPRCRNADLSAALQARTHDPFWFLARQWQFGELSGDDAGSPIIASVTSVDAPLDRYAPGTGGPRAIPAGTPLEALVAREAVRPAATAVDYRQAADAGLYFLRLLRSANLSDIETLVTAYVTQYGIAAPTAAQQAALDAPALALAAVVARRVPDGSS